MYQRVALSLLLLLAPCLAFSTQSRTLSPFKPSATCPEVLVPRIIGGMDTPAFSPFMAALFNPSGLFVCSGVLLSPKWVLTAAHCAVTEDFYVRLGGKRAGSGKKGRIRQVVNHFLYDAATDKNDISVIELKERAPGKSEYVLVSKDSKGPKAGVYAKVIGYGPNSKKGRVDKKSVLRSVDVPIASRKVCKKTYAPFARPVTSGMICAGKKGCDACQGDSGGPLVQFGEDGVVVVGIVSWGNGCAKGKFPGVYTNVSGYKGWLKRVGVEFEVGTAVQFRRRE